MCLVGSVSGGDVTTDCLLPVDVGPCFAYQIRWYHDPTTSTCRQFHFGGCQGNANNFFTLDDCQTACIDQPNDVTSVKPNGIYIVSTDAKHWRRFAHQNQLHIMSCFYNQQNWFTLQLVQLS